MCGCSAPPIEGESLSAGRGRPIVRTQLWITKWARSFFGVEGWVDGFDFVRAGGDLNAMGYGDDIEIGEDDGLDELPEGTIKRFAVRAYQGD